MYAIAGITGNTGGAAAEALLAAGHEVRGLTRAAAKATSWADRVELVELELSDAAALTEALRDVEGAYLLIPSAWAAPDYFGYAKPLIEAIASAIREADVPRVVILSSVGAQHATGNGPIAVLHLLERALRGRPGLTFLRPAYFHENLGGSLDSAAEGTLPVFFDPERVVPMVAARDVGAEAARQLLVPPADADAIVQLAGPKDYPFSAVARELAAALGHDVATLTLPPEAIIEPLRQTGAGHIAELYAEMNRGLETGVVDFDPSFSVRRGATPLSQTVAQLLSS